MLLAGLLLAPTAAQAAAAATKTTRTTLPPRPAQPNVLMVVLDDLRPMFPAFGYAGVEAPHMTGLADRGLAFKNAYVQQAVCGPSRNSFMTGRRPDATRAWNFQTDFRRSGVDAATGRRGADWTALPQAFKRNGYVTAAVGKLYHPRSPANNDYPASWSSEGFATAAPANISCAAAGDPNPDHPTAVFSCDGLAAPAATATHTAPMAQCNFSYISPFGQIWMPNCTVTTDPTSGKPWNPTVCDLPDDQCVDKAIADAAAAMLRVLVATGKPWFLGAGFHKPHPFWSIPQRFQDMYLPGGARELPLPTHPEPPAGMPATAYYACKVALTNKCFLLSSTYSRLTPYSFPLPLLHLLDDHNL